MTRKKVNRPSFVAEHVDMLNAERKERGISLRVLSELSGVSLDTLGSYVYGAYMPTRKNYNKLAVVLGWEEWE